MSMKSFFLFLIISCLYSKSLSSSFNLKIGMTEDEIIKTVNGTLLSNDHSLWRSQVLIQGLCFINRDNLRLVQVKNDGREYCLAIELNQHKTLKNLFYIPLHETWPKCKATFVGDYWKSFNQVKIGDNYDEVIKIVGQKTSSDFYCNSGVWYIRYYYYFDNQTRTITFFAATGKVADIFYADPEYVDFRSIKHENGDIEFIFD